MKKPKVIINTDIKFNEGLREELQGYMDEGTLEEYGITNYWFEKGTVKLKPGDIIAIHYADNEKLYCEVVLCGTTKTGQQMVNMKYKDFTGSEKGKQNTNEEKIKCLFCHKELGVKDIIISSNGFAYCKKCKHPMLDMTIQSEDHFFKRNESQIEHADYISLMMEGFM